MVVIHPQLKRNEGEKIIVSVIPKHLIINKIVDINDHNIALIKTGFVSPEFYKLRERIFFYFKPCNTKKLD